jgi:hypothetical protein
MKLWLNFYFAIAVFASLLIPQAGRTQNNRILAEQAIFEEAARLSEIFGSERSLVFVGNDSRPFYEALRMLAEKDELSPRTFALTGRIHWVPNAAEVWGLREKVEAPPLPGHPKRSIDEVVQILSNRDATRLKINEDCGADVQRTRYWILGLPDSGGSRDCVREIFLEIADRDWTQVTDYELRLFGDHLEHSRFYALKRRLWRHMFLMLTKGLVDEARDVAISLKNSPKTKNETDLTIRSMIFDFLEVTRRFFPKAIEPLTKALGNCEISLA